MMIVNPDGTVHRYKKIDGEMVALEPLHHPDFVAPVNPLETVVDSIAYWIQAARESGNPPEMVMEREPVEGSVRIAAMINRMYVEDLKASDAMSTLAKIQEAYVAS